MAYLDRTTPIGPVTSPLRSHGPAPLKPGTASFGEALQRAGDGVQFSRHAQKRVDRRDLDLDDARLGRLNNAITHAAEKGSRNSVVMLDDLAVVVDVRERTVITAMNAEAGRERVFTNIDSVVIA